MNVKDAQYRYLSPEGTCANAYILPEIVRQFRSLWGGSHVTVLDIGCGNGYIGSKLAELGHKVSGVDSSIEGINVARSAYPGGRFEVGSVYDDALLEIVGNHVDCVLSLEVIEHLFYPKILLEQSYRVLKLGGHLIISTPYHGYLKNLAISVVNGWDKHFAVHWDGGHIKFFSKKTLAQMASDAGFKNPRFSSVGRVPGLWKSMIMIVEK